MICTHCRSRKVRCDRGHPCSSCVKRDEADSCIYERLPVALALPSPKTEINRQAAEDRLSRLEATVKDLMQTTQTSSSASASASARLSHSSGHSSFSPNVPNAVGHSEPLPEIPSENIEQQRHQPQDSKETRDIGYVGATHWSAILDDIHGLKEILESTRTEPDEHISAFEPAYLGAEIIFGTSHNYDIQHMITHFLPSRVEVDRFLSLYFRGETFIVPFVHSFQFQRQYNEFWLNKEIVDPLWLSMLFSICCLASLQGENQYSQDELVTRRSVLHEAAGMCLVLGEYYKPQPFALEALAMYVSTSSLPAYILDPISCSMPFDQTL